MRVFVSSVLLTVAFKYVLWHYSLKSKFCGQFPHNFLYWPECNQWCDNKHKYDKGWFSWSNYLDPSLTVHQHTVIASICQNPLQCTKFGCHSAVNQISVVICLELAKWCHFVINVQTIFDFAFCLFKWLCSVFQQ